MSTHEQAVKHRKSVQKAVENNDIPAVLDLFKHLNHYKASEEFLRKTEIGLCIGKLRNHTDPNVASGAKALVRKWKMDVIAAGHTKGQDKAKTELPNTPSTPIASSNGTPTSDKPSVKERTVASDGVTIPSRGDKTREKCTEMLYSSLATNSGADPGLLMKRAGAIENTVYTSIGAVNPAYKAKIRSFYLNLRDKSNPGLREAVTSGEIPVQKFCSMSKQDMASEERKAQDRKIQQENLFKARGAGPAVAETDQFKCGRCKSRKCTYYQMQTRSADEPMTTFVTCTNCENRWKS
ncbi:transcription elongation factor TFIIS [Dimargaris verticillata]|uniref:Transcription elongation factor n=1 Tax=Dimargaris verticillata TaxID=2761393 RepID=A0A9W8EEU5_9FUNG|nr:transcription elongation factor TFIIS [Dimargaris verticillata]